MQSNRLSFRQLLPLSLITALILSACGGSSDFTPQPVPVQVNVDFGTEPAGWVSGTSDFTTDTKPTDIVTEYRTLPAPLSGKGLYTYGTNRSDDLFIYIKKKYLGFAPNTQYALSFQATIVSNVATGCFGVGGSPGESVWFFGGASPTEPLTVQQGDQYTMNIDRGGQAGSGKYAQVLGTIGNTSNDCGKAPYMEKKLSNQTPLNVTTGADGSLWLLFGIDSGFESTSHIYYKNITLNAVPILNK
ncbi:hypothetical protein [Undibacterium sp. TS12]|uniref:hypothetical protein n=1 Tax=Undibacterium sp. TS12 TaxID=2908202 RepID=UPI001F4CA844|nr:hypothetical protein [Undibacterium sp. TS12]MCH8620837.1 hypothetical protein [Undibacterium sp. TS12]